MKQVTEQDVIDTVTALLVISPIVTTLDVKNHLRGLGYYAAQHEVSDMLFELHSQLGLIWNWSSNGSYREYSNPINSSASISVSTLTSGNVGDWEASSTQVALVEYFDGGMTRSQVRYAFSKLSGVHYNQVRAKRIK